ncbi:MAG: hypothetical protein Q4D62_15865 [Planctomycetia bacterium]|nr:hypothetical protein [Planctomycetia bacterium]
MTKQLLTETFYRRGVTASQSQGKPDVYLFAQFLPEPGATDLSHWNRPLTLEGGTLVDDFVFQGGLYYYRGYLQARSDRTNAILSTSLSPGLNLNNFSCEIWIQPYYKRFTGTAGTFTLQFLTDNGYLQLTQTSTNNDIPYCLQLDVDGKIQSNVEPYLEVDRAYSFPHILLTGCNGTIYVYVNLPSGSETWSSEVQCQFSLNAPSFTNLAHSMVFHVNDCGLPGLRLLNEKCLLTGEWDKDTNAYLPKKSPSKTEPV